MAILTGLALLLSRSPLPAHTDGMGSLMEGWIPERIEKVYHDKPISYMQKETILQYRNGETRTVNFMDMSFVGALPTDSEIPFLIFMGRTCNECDERIKIIIFNPKMMTTSTKPSGYYSYPGKLFDVYTEKLVRKSRAFFGECLAAGRIAAVWFSVDLMESGKWEEGVYVAEVKGSTLMNGWADGPLPQLEDTLMAVRNKICFEIPGKNLSTEP